MITMKFHVAFLAALFTFSVASRVSAQNIPYDSLAVNYLITDAGIDNPENIEGLPDKAEITLMTSQFLGVMFQAGTQAVTFQKGAEIHVYWQRQLTDSSAADIEFMAFDANLVPLKYGPTVRVMETGPPYESKETTITVPDTGYSGYNALSITIASDTGADNCSLDAIILMQSGVVDGVSEQLASREAVLASYPNPFEHSSLETVHIDAPASGRGELWVSDALGREVERVPIGELQPGGQDVSISLKGAGIFFARLMIDGAPVGPPLKLVAE